MSFGITESAGLDSVPKIDKQILFSTDDGKLYADFHDKESGEVVRKMYGADITALENSVAELQEVAARLAEL